MQRYDSIIIGAGHNGLVCAAYLAQKGQRVLVLETADTAGGLTANREFHPGYHASVAHSIGHLPSEIVNDLKLEAHGLDLSEALTTVGLDAAGRHVALGPAGISGAGDEDAAAWPEYRRLMGRFADALAPFWLKTIPRIGAGSLSELATFAQVGWSIRRLGKADMREFLRIASLPVRDLMDEFFEHPLLKTVLGWDGLIGSKMAPRSPNGAVLTMLYRMHGGGLHRVAASGGQGLARALTASAEASGAIVRCGVAVEKVLIEGNGNGLSVKGVALAGGETLEADRVISSTDPQRTFLDLVGVEHLDIGFTNRIRRLRSEGFVGKLHLALDGLPQFTNLDRPDGRLIIAPDLDRIEFAFDAAKYGECPEEPVMEVLLPSLHDASLAPAGGQVLSAHVMYVPYALKHGRTEDARETMLERSLDMLARYAPDLKQHIVHAEFLTPADLETEYRITGGHWHHTEFAMDQMLMMRPTYEAAQYATPIPGLWLCGAGCHPAGDLTGAAGHNAAQEILG